MSTSPPHGPTQVVVVVVVTVVVLVVVTVVVAVVVPLDPLELDELVVEVPPAPPFRGWSTTTLPPQAARRAKAKEVRKEVRASIARASARGGPRSIRHDWALRLQRRAHARASSLRVTPTALRAIAEAAAASAEGPWLLGQVVARQLEEILTAPITTRAWEVDERRARALLAEVTGA